MECEKLEVQGGFKIHGLLNAGDIDIKLLLGCEAEDIGGERIHVRRDHKVKLLDDFVPGLAPKLKAKVIEGDDIYLEQTYAQTVRETEWLLAQAARLVLWSIRNPIIRMRIRSSIATFKRKEVNCCDYR